MTPFYSWITVILLFIASWIAAEIVSRQHLNGGNKNEF